MGVRKHFGYNAEDDGRKTAEDVTSGKMSAKQAAKRYEEAKQQGQGEEFKKGYGTAAVE